MSYLAKAQDIYDMLAQGQLMDAFEKYYADNVVITEPRGTWEGKDACRQHELDFLAMVKEFNGMGVTAIGSNEATGTTFVESWMEVTFHNDYRVKMEQVSVQHWQGDQIVKEQFYYDNK